MMAIAKTPRISSGYTIAPPKRSASSAVFSSSIAQCPPLSSAGGGRADTGGRVAKRQGDADAGEECAPWAILAAGNTDAGAVADLIRFVTKVDAVEPHLGPPEVRDRQML